MSAFTDEDLESVKSAALRLGTRYAVNADVLLLLIARLEAAEAFGYMAMNDDPSFGDTVAWRAWRKAAGK